MHGGLNTCTCDVKQCCEFWYGMTVTRHHLFCRLLSLCEEMVTHKPAGTLQDETENTYK